MSSQLLKNLEEIDQLLKAQITRGGNSDRKEWAGSKSKDEDVPSPAPNGTNYVSTKDIAHKAIEDLSTDELEAYLNMRKSQPANPRAAEEEILRIPGVSKSICDDCGGAGRDALSKSFCGTCGGHGIVFDVPNAEAIQMIKSIADKYNLGKGGHPHSGGASGSADPTPSKMEPFEAEKLDRSGKDVSKKRKDKDEYKDEINKAKKKMKKGDDEGLPEFIKEKMEDDEDDEEMEEKSVKKSIAKLTESMYVLLKSVKSLAEQQNEMGSVLEAVGSNQVNISKSLVNEGPQAARTPRAIDPRQVQVLNKGFVTDAPGYAEGAPRYGRDVLLKAAGQMAVEGKLGTMEVLRLDSNSPIEDKILKSIEGWIDTNGIPSA